MKLSYYLTAITLLFLLLCTNEFTKAQSQQYADSLLRVIEKSPGDKAAYSELNRTIVSICYNDTFLAMEFAKKQYAMAIKENNQLEIGKSILNMGICYDIRGNFDSALNKYQEALDLAEKFDLIKLQGDIYNNFSITQAVLGNMEESTSNALKALAIYEETNDSTLMARIYNNLGARYSEMQNFDEALAYYQKAAIINENIHDNKKLAFNYGNIGLLYYGKEETEKALEYFLKSYSLQDSINDKYNFSIALHNLALAYLQKKEFKKAMNYEQKANKLSTEINDELGVVSSLNGIAQINYEQGNRREALKFFNQSAAIAERIGARYYLIRIYENTSKIYAELKDFENAFIYNQKYNALNDSIMTTEKDKAIQKVNEFEKEKRQQEIQLLTKDSEIQKLNIKREKTIRNSVAAVGILILILAIALYQRFRFVRKTKNELSEKNIIINKEKDRSDELLLNILPAETAEELKTKGRSEARHFEMATVMFMDIKGFTFIAEKLSPQELVDEIDFCFKNFDRIITKHNIEKIKTIGDAYMCAGGLPVANTTNPLDVVTAALEIQDFMKKLKKQKIAEQKPHFELRIGINTGPLVAGIVGTKKFQYDIWGDTVNVASRMESSGEVGEVNISQMTYEKIKDHFVCEYRGKIEAKNKGEVDMYFVKGKA
ncbi:MAG TPA: adenylate/guanylate cyclase domain-containing protein [Bacteroidales bacterium]